MKRVVICLFVTFFLCLGVCGETAVLNEVRPELAAPMLSEGGETLSPGVTQAPQPQLRNSVMSA